MKIGWVSLWPKNPQNSEGPDMQWSWIHTGSRIHAPGHEKQWKSANSMWSFVIFCEVTFQKWSTDMMLSLHSDSEAQWNNHGPLVDQDESPHIQPNHLDPMELAAQQNRFHTARLCPSAGSGVLPIRWLWRFCRSCHLWLRLAFAMGKKDKKSPSSKPMLNTAQQQLQRPLQAWLRRMPWSDVESIPPWNWMNRYPQNDSCHICIWR